MGLRELEGLMPIELHTIAGFPDTSYPISNFMDLLHQYERRNRLVMNIHANSSFIRAIRNWGRAAYDEGTHREVLTSGLIMHVHYASIFLDNSQPDGVLEIEYANIETRTERRDRLASTTERETQLRAEYEAPAIDEGRYVGQGFSGYSGAVSVGPLQAMPTEPEPTPEEETNIEPEGDRMGDRWDELQ